MIQMFLKYHHIYKCTKNCRKVDALTSILAQLSSSTPIVIVSEWLKNWTKDASNYIDINTPISLYTSNYNYNIIIHVQGVYFVGQYFDVYRILP
jgi:ribosomal protein S9